MIYLCKPDGRVLYANPAAAGQFGLAPDSIAGKRQEDLFSPPVAARHKAVIGRVSETGVTFTTQAPEALDGDEHAVLIETTLVPVKDETGRVYAVMGVSRNVTERKRLQQTLSDSEQRMLDYQSQLRRLASAMAMAEEQERRRIARDLHDGVGQSLVLCKMKIEQVRAEVSTAEKRRNLTAALSAIENAIRDTRTLTFQLSPPVLHELGLKPAVQWLAENLETEHGVAVKVRARGNVEPQDSTTRVFVFQAVRELLMNVLKHARASAVTVQLKGDGENIVAAVEDNGQGYDTAKVRATGMRTNGMGLFNVRERVKMLGGSLTVSSRPGSGTRAELVVPGKPRDSEEKAS